MKPYPSYKESDVEWIGKIPSGWNVRKTKYLFEIKKIISGELGYDVLSITQQGVKIKDIISGKGQLSMNYSKYQIVQIGDFAMNHMDLLTGYVDISKYDGVTSPDYRVFSLTDKNSVSIYFLYLFQIGYSNKIFYGFGQGSSQLGRWRFPTRQFNNFKFPYPNTEEQQQISIYLDHKTQLIDSLIEKTQQKIELLKEQRTSLINEVVTKGLNPDVEMKDSGIEWIGEIPSGWDVTPLKYICAYNQKSLSTNTEPDYELDYIEISDVDSLGNIGEATHYQFSKSPSRCRRIANKNDIIISTVRTYLRSIGFIRNSVSDLVCSTGFCVVTPYLDRIIPKILFYLVRTESFISKVISLSEGVSYPSIQSEKLVGIKVVIPPLSEQQQIVDYLDKETSKIDSLIEKEGQRVDLLKEYRQSLISEVVTGKVDVRDEVAA